MVDKEALIQSFYDRLLQGESYARINQARTQAEAVLGQSIPPGHSLTKVVDEAMEAAIVRVAPLVLAQAKTSHEAYDQMVDLLNRQPTLSVRSSTSVLQQAYSTPVPIAYLAATLADITPETTVYEPTAGNGALLITAHPARVIANEINPERWAELAKRGYGQLFRDDASTYHPEIQVDRVITNPPFGPVQDENGRIKRFELPGNSRGTRQIDQAIALQALKTLKDDGRAVLILGGKLGDEESQRSDRYNTIESRGFFYALYQHYNVTQHFSIWGDLYRKQGAGFPIDLIVIEGRGQAQRELPAADVPIIYKSFEALKELLPNEPIQQRHPSGLPELPLGLAATGRGGSVPISGQTPGELEGIVLAGLSTSDHAPDSMDAPPMAGEQQRGPDANPSPTHTSLESSLPSGTSESLRGLRDEGTRTPMVVDSGMGRDVRGTGRNSGDQISVEQWTDVPSFYPSNQQRGSDGVDDRTQYSHPGELAFRVDLRPERVALTPDPDPRIQTMTTVETEHSTTDAPLNVAYFPRSRGRSPGTLIPANMATAAQKALDKLEQAVGDVDAFVQQRMGYSSKEELWQYLYAEQVDANALAFWQRDKSKVFLNGDQTGNGKGRFCASQIVDAINQGYIPVFVTQKSTLYVSMLADLKDIGKPGVRIFATDSNLRLELPDGSKLRTGNPANQEEEMQRLMQQGIGSYNAVFTTYSQLQTIESGKEPFRRDFLRDLAPRAIFIFDEAHEAGGSTGEKGWTSNNTAPNRAEFARELIDSSAGTVFASATAIKDPAVMDLYVRRSDAAEAVTSIASLQRTLKEGGVPLQQMMAAKFVASGQMLRRERSFEGVSFQARVVPVDHQVADDIAAIMRAISQFDLVKEKAVAKLSKQLKKEAKVASEDNSIGQSGARSTNFTSLMNNAIDQGLLCQKAEATVQATIAALQQGQKPVIAVANTMDAFIGQYAEDHNLQPGDAIPISFGDVLSRYLERSRDVTVKDHEGKGTRRRMADDELGTEALAAYDNARDIIESSDLSGIPLSSIDYIKWRLAQEGYRVDEITGRHNIIDYTETGEQGYARRSTSETRPQARVEIVDRFNAGDLDVLVLNRAGATGINLHASEKFADQKQRHLIMAQAERDINQVMQMLGRVNRFGQVSEPEITLLMSDIPAEKRLGALLSHKMATLNANTTADRESALSVSNVVDFLTPYGEEVINEILDENPELEAKLAFPREKLQGESEIETISRTTGRIPLLSIQEQEEIYALIESETLDLVAQKQAMGESVLEAQQLDLDARTIARMEVIPDDSGLQNEFIGPVYLDVVDARVPVKPFSQLEVINLVRENLGLERVKAVADHPLGEVEKLAQTQTQQAISELRQTTNTYREAILRTKHDPYAREKASDRLKTQFSHVSSVLRDFTPGSSVRVVSPEGNITYGVVARVWQKGHNGSPAAPTNWRTQILTDNLARTLTIPLTRLNAGKEAVCTSVSRQETNWEGQDIYEAFDLRQKTERIEQQIFQGNLLKAYEKFPTGKFLNYTDHQGKIQQGLVMPASFDIQESLRSEPVAFQEPGQVKAFLSDLTQHQGAVKTLDEVLTIKSQMAARSGSTAAGFVLQTPKSAIGDTFSLDRDIITLAGSDFYSVSDRMELVVPADRIEALLHLLMKEKGHTLAAFDFKDQARNYLGIKLPELKQIDNSIETGRNQELARGQEILKLAERIYAYGEQVGQLAFDGEFWTVAAGNYDISYNPANENFFVVGKTNSQMAAQQVSGILDPDCTCQVAEADLAAFRETAQYLDEIGFVAEQSPAMIQAIVQAKLKAGVEQVVQEEIAPLDAAESVEIATTLEQVLAIVQQLQTAGVLAIDTETTGLDPHTDEVRLIQIAAGGHPVAVIDCAALSQEDLAPLNELFQGPAEKVLQNAKFDLQMLWAKGLDIQGPIFDTMLASQTLEAGLDKDHKLEAIVQRHLGTSLDKSGQKSDWSGELTQGQLDYAARDAAILLPLREALQDRLNEKHLTETASLEFRAVFGVAEMEWNGMGINREKLQACASELREQKAHLEEVLWQTLPTSNHTQQRSLLQQTPQGIDLESPKQLLQALQDLGIPVNNTRKETLIPMKEQYPVVATLLEYRKVARLLSTNAEGYEKLINPMTGRIHPNLNQCGAVTGRFSCTEPNLQNVPRRSSIKGCFEPGPGNVLIKADYSQIELRIAAEISGEPRMQAAYQQGQDLHALTASLVLQKPVESVTPDERRLAKAINFGLIYGMQAPGFQIYAKTQYDVSLSLAQAEQHRTRFFESSYPGLVDWHQQVKAERASTCETLGGRSRQWEGTAPFTEIINAPVQGTSADITKEAIACFRELRDSLPERLDAKLLMQVHDEIVLEVPQEQAEQAGQLLVEAMRSAGERFLHTVPVEVEAIICEDWSGRNARPVLPSDALQPVPQVDKSSELSELTKAMRNRDLEAVATCLGLEPDPHDRHKWRNEDHTISINDNKFMDWRTEKGSVGAIDLVMLVTDWDFKAAVQWLSQQNLPEQAEFTASQEPHSLQLPVHNEQTWPEVRQYLTDTRGLPANFVDKLYQEGLVYSDDRRNVIFLRHALQAESQGWERQEITGANLRGTIGDFKQLAPGSSRENGWFWLGIGRGDVQRVVLTESAIDAISLAVLDRETRNQTGGRTLYLSTDGTGSVPIAALQTILDRGGQVVAAFDNDAAGKHHTERLAQSLSQISSLTPTRGKDWNEQLLAERKTQEQTLGKSQGQSPSVSVDELRQWYKQARDIGRPAHHLKQIEEVGKAFVQEGTPLSDRDQQAMQRDQADWQHQAQTIATQARIILKTAGTPESGGVVFTGKTYTLFAHEDSLFVLASDRGVQLSEIDATQLPNSVIAREQGIILKEEAGEILPNYTSTNLRDVQRFETFAALVKEQAACLSVGGYDR